MWGGGVGVWVSLLFHSPGGEFEQVITLTKFQLVAQLPAHVPLKLFVEKTVGSFFAGLASPAPLSSPVSENARCLVGSFPPSTTPFDYFHSSLSTTWGKVPTRGFEPVRNLGGRWLSVAWCFHMNHPGPLFRFQLTGINGTHLEGVWLRREPWHSCRKHLFLLNVSFFSFFSPTVFLFFSLFSAVLPHHFTVLLCHLAFSRLTILLPAAVQCCVGDTCLASFATVWRRGGKESCPMGIGELSGLQLSHCTGDLQTWSTMTPHTHAHTHTHTHTQMTNISGLSWPLCGALQPWPSFNQARGSHRAAFTHPLPVRSCLRQEGCLGQEAVWTGLW